MTQWWYVIAGNGCGAVRVVNDVVVETAPYFWRFRGRDIAWLKRHCRVCLPMGGHLGH